MFENTSFINIRRVNASNLTPKASLEIRLIAGYLLNHIWDILIVLLIVYEIIENSLERYKQRKDTSVAERKAPNIFNLGCGPGPIKITGRKRANTGVISGAIEFDRNGVVTIANLVPEPITIAAQYLTIGDSKIPCRVFFRAWTSQPGPTVENILLAGGACETCDLILRFSDSDEPRMARGKLYLSSSNRGNTEADFFSVELSIV